MSPPRPFGTPSHLESLREPSPLDQAVERSAAAGIVALADARADDDASVFQGPWPFGESDRARFFGRDAEIQELHASATQQRATVLFGISGFGKSSLLDAGLVPLLRRGPWLPVPLRIRFEPGGPAPIDQLRAQFAVALERSDAAGVRVEVEPWHEGDSPWHYFHRTPIWGPGSLLLTPILIFDQFEELFVHGRSGASFRPEVRAFVFALRDLVENSPPTAAEGDSLPSLLLRRQPAHFVFALREDYLADLEDLTLEIPALARNRVHLRPLAGPQALEAVLAPTPGIVDEPTALRILDAVTTSGAHGRTPEQVHDGLATLEVHPMLLSLLCWQLDRERIRGGRSTIDAAAVDFGVRDRIVGDFCGAAVATASDDVIRFVEHRLVTSVGHRTSAPVEDLSPEDRSEVDRLVERHLLRRHHVSGQEHVELVHDLLALAFYRRREHRTAMLRARQRRRVLTAIVGGAVLTGALILAVAWWIDQGRVTEVERRLSELRSDRDRLNGENQKIRADDALRRVSATASKDALEAEISELKRRLKDLDDSNKRRETEASTRFSVDQGPPLTTALTSFAGIVAKIAARPASERVDPTSWREFWVALEQLLTPSGASAKPR